MGVALLFVIKWNIMVYAILALLFVIKWNIMEYSYFKMLNEI